MKFGAIEIDPAKNPAILDTATWDPKGAWDILRRVEEKYWRCMHQTVGQPAVKPRLTPAPVAGGPSGTGPEAKAPRFRRGSPVNEHCVPYAASCARYQASVFFLAGLEDGQQVFISIGPDAPAVSPRLSAGDPGQWPGLTAIGKKLLGDGNCAAIYKTDAAVIDRYCRLISPDKGPKALGATPGLGIGSRMSTCAWPGVWRAMHNCSFSANAIQNSVRELNLLEDVWAGRPACTNYLPGFGTLEEGHTGSTFEGLWVAGVLEALKTDTRPRYGADADHIMVKRGAQGISQAKRVIDAARYYTFFTLDVSDILDYAAMGVGSEAAARCARRGAAEAYLAGHTPQSKQRKDVVAYHSQKRRIAGQIYCLAEATIGRLIGKYWSALEAVGELYNHIKSRKDGVAFDLELSIDENPPEVGAFESVTTDEELLFLVLEMQRRQIPLTHIAPNLGIEKGLDYRGPDGLEGLEQRVCKLHRIAAEHAVILDCHSGDDLESITRKVIGRAANAQIHFKISPALQIIFAETLSDFNPERFRFWWDDTLAYARRETAAGCEAGGNAEPSPRHAVFRHYCFATVGRRDERGQFIHREKFYTLPADFYREYQRRVEYYLGEVADDVFNRG
jgi:hypothetical protein